MDSALSKPIICTFVELTKAMEALHQGNKTDLDLLHDLWLLGAPTPNSRILVAKHYDPRKVQPGNFEARIVSPLRLAAWIMDVSKRRGFPYSMETATKIALGEAV